MKWDAYRTIWGNGDCWSKKHSLEVGKVQGELCHRQSWHDKYVCLAPVPSQTQQHHRPNPGPWRQEIAPRQKRAAAILCIMTNQGKLYFLTKTGILSRRWLCQWWIHDLFWSHRRILAKRAWGTQHLIVHPEQMGWQMTWWQHCPICWRHFEVPPPARYSNTNQRVHQQQMRNLDRHLLIITFQQSRDKWSWHHDFTTRHKTTSCIKKTSCNVEYYHP